MKTKDNIEVSVLSNLVRDDSIAQLGTDLEDEAKKLFGLYNVEIQFPLLFPFLFLCCGY